MKSFLAETHLFLCLMKSQNLHYQGLFLKTRLETHPSVTGIEGTPMWLLGKEGRFSSHPTVLLPAVFCISTRNVCFIIIIITIIILNKFLHLPDLLGGSNLTPAHCLHTSLQHTLSTFFKCL